ncbi:MAG: hypothetical protein PQJ58_01900 [Spirochaetales bacterium]|nr:hypothetical protein [Spirochaetales bacterium]
MGRLKTIFWPVAALLSPLPALLLYFRGDFSHLNDPFSLGMLFGLSAYTYFLVTLLISSRIRFLDRLYGHDRVMHFHSLLALGALILGIVHRQLKVLIFPYMDLQVFLGFLPLLLILIVFLVTLTVMVPGVLHRIGFMNRFRLFVNRRLKLDYSLLKTVHNSLVLALLLLSFHVLLASSTGETWTRLIYMGALASFTLYSWIRHKLIRPRRNRKAGLVLEDIRDLGGHVTELVIRGSGEGSLPSWKAGQFAYFRFPGSVVKGEEHPFTISSAPVEGHVAVAVKNLGDYTSLVPGLETGQTVVLDGPYGHFGYSRGGRSLFIAGGIGITPFLSILKDLASRKSTDEITLLWAVRNQEDLVFDDLLQSMSSRLPGFRYLPLLSGETFSPEEKHWRGGRINRDLLDELTGSGQKKQQIYFCGPPGLRRKVFKDLKSLGIRTSSVRYEKFSLG